MSAEPSFIRTALPASPGTTAMWRGTAFFLLWMLLMQSLKPAHLAMGVLASVGTTWVSPRLLPPSSGCLRFGKLLALLPHFLWESVLEGVDVARRALDLSPGPGGMRYASRPAWQRQSSRTDACCSRSPS